MHACLKARVLPAEASHVIKRTHLQHLVGVAVLAAALSAGWLVTSTLQDRSAPAATGEHAACWSLDGSVAQLGCLSDRFVEGARAAATGLSGQARSEAINEYVRAQERAAATDPQLAGTCHPGMHELGRSEGRRAANADAVPLFPTASSQLCTAGYVHGLAEGYLVGTPSADVAAVFPKLCHDASAREGCAHGVGHALLRARVDTRPVQASAAAVDRCGDLPGDFPTNCMNGVYMELAMRTEPTAVTPDEFVATCSSAGVTEQLSCWSYLTLDLTTNDVAIEEVPNWCAKADLPGQFQCIEEYGRALGVEGVGACGDLDARIELRERCIDGAIALHVGSGHVSKREAAAACSDLDGALDAFCSNAVDRYDRGRAKVAGEST